jgi:hypothetical protein
MKTSELHSVWSMPDNTRLTAKQFSFRLPVHVAAKLSALCDLYPNKNRTQIVGDLLSTALEDVAAALPSAKGRLIERIQPMDGNGFEIYEDVGLQSRFKESANKYYAELERELGNEEPGEVFPMELTRTRFGEAARCFVMYEDLPE